MRYVIMSCKMFLWYTQLHTQSTLLHCSAGANQQLRQLPAVLRDVVAVPGEPAVRAVVRGPDRGAGALHTRRQQGLQRQQGRGAWIETEFIGPLSGGVWPRPLYSVLSLVTQNENCVWLVW